MSWTARFVAAMACYGIFTVMVSVRPDRSLVAFDVQSAGLLMVVVGLAALTASAPALWGGVRSKHSLVPSRAPRAEVLVSAFQAQAKAKDDTRKAEIRRHVERPVPPITEAGRAAVTRALGVHVALRHVFPPRLPQRGLSYLGGQPIIPESFDWPMVHNRQGLLERLTFVAQIDCADLPPEARAWLPEEGILYFFAPLSGAFDSAAQHVVVRYLQGPVTQRWAPDEHPFVGVLPSSGGLSAVWPGPRTRFDRVEVVFGWIADPTDEEVAARSAEGFPHEVAGRIRQERLDAFFGEVPAQPPRAPEGDSAGWSDPGFPHNWKAVRVLRAFVEAWVSDQIGLASEAAAADPSVGSWTQELQRLRSQVAEAFFPSVSVGRSDVDAPSEAEKQAIRDVVQRLREVDLQAPARRSLQRAGISAWIVHAARAGAEAGLVDPVGASHVPAAWVAALAGRHTTRAHRMLGQGDLVQTAAHDMRDRHLLLLQLGRDEALGWWFGEMGPLQYWITPEDLAERRFGRAVLTMEAY